MVAPSDLKDCFAGGRGKQLKTELIRGESKRVCEFGGLWNKKYVADILN